MAKISEKVDHYQIEQVKQAWSEYSSRAEVSSKDPKNEEYLYLAYLLSLREGSAAAFRDQIVNLGEQDLRALESLFYFYPSFLEALLDESVNDYQLQIEQQVMASVWKKSEKLELHTYTLTFEWFTARIYSGFVLLKIGNRQNSLIHNINGRAAKVFARLLENYNQPVSGESLLAAFGSATTSFQELANVIQELELTIDQIKQVHGFSKDRMQILIDKETNMFVLDINE